jgi:hypothetical protein
MHVKRQVRRDDGPHDRRPRLRPPGGHHRGQAQDGHDRLRQPHARRHEVERRLLLLHSFPWIQLPSLPCANLLFRSHNADDGHRPPTSASEC